MSQLSSGICRRLGGAPKEEVEHLTSGYTVQLLSVKKVPPLANSAPVDRYRIIISDGVHFVQAILATQLNDLVTTGKINKKFVVIIDKLACNFVQEKRLIIIYDLRVVSRDEKKIGTPTTLYTAPASADGQAAHAPRVVAPPAPVAALSLPRDFELTPSIIAKAQKHCRFAASSLDYEDPEQARKELRAALALLEG